MLLVDDSHIEEQGISLDPETESLSKGPTHVLGRLHAEAAQKALGVRRVDGVSGC